MRNLAQYPVTKDEMLRTLRDLKAEWLKEQTEKMILGGIRGAVLNEVIKIIEASDHA